MTISLQQTQLWSIYASGSAASASAKAALGVMLDTLIPPYLSDEDFFVGKKESEAENKWRLIKTVNNSDFSISPNPASQSLKLSFKSKEAKQLNVTITDANSALVYTSTMTNPRSEIDVGNWKNGLYIIKGTDDLGQSYFKKFNVIH